MNIVGASRHGAYAEYVAVPQEALVRLPPGTPVQDMALAAESLPTSYHAITSVAKVKMNEMVAIFGGTGGLGLGAVQICSSIGAKAIAIGRKSWKLDKARSMGAQFALAVDEFEKVTKRMFPEGFDVALEISGNWKMAEMACRSVKAGGRVVIVGYLMKDFGIPAKRLMWYELQIMGARAFTHREVTDVIQMIHERRLRPGELISHKIPLGELNDGFALLDRGDALRILAIP
jgi:D-arabinose 1-dehydrogenase-like Zn-dependent alcohol dehydrogenase